MKTGKFITFEGGEGAGKSTLVRSVAEFLTEQNISVLSTREPGGSPGSEDIRKLLVCGEPGRWDKLSETLLFNAARRDHLVTKIWPALGKGTWVLSDRYADSTIAYQGYGHGFDKRLLLQIDEIVGEGFRPDLTFILDLPVEEGLQRSKKRLEALGGDQENRFEKMDVSFHEKIRKGFHEICEQNSDRCVMINALKSPEDVKQDVITILKNRLLHDSAA